MTTRENPSGHGWKGQRSARECALLGDIQNGVDGGGAVPALPQHRVEEERNFEAPAGIVTKGGGSLGKQRHGI